MGGWDDKSSKASSRASSWQSWNSGRSGGKKGWEPGGSRRPQTPRLMPLYQMCSAGCGGWEYQRNKKTHCRNPECLAPLNERTVLDNGTERSDSPARDRTGPHGQSKSEVERLEKALEALVPGAAAATAQLRKDAADAATAAATSGGYVLPTAPVPQRVLGDSQKKCKAAYALLEQCTTNVLQTEAKLAKFYTSIDEMFAKLQKQEGELRAAQKAYNEAADTAQAVLEKTKTAAVAQVPEADGKVQAMLEQAKTLSREQLQLLLEGTAETAAVSEANANAAKSQPASMEVEEQDEGFAIGFSRECEFVQVEAQAQEPPDPPLQQVAAAAPPPLQQVAAAAVPVPAEEEATLDMAAVQREEETIEDDFFADIKEAGEEDAAPGAADDPLVANAKSILAEAADNAAKKVAAAFADAAEREKAEKEKGKDRSERSRSPAGGTSDGGGIADTNEHNDDIVHAGEAPAKAAKSGNTTVRRSTSEGAKSASSSKSGKSAGKGETTLPKGSEHFAALASKVKDRAAQAVRAKKG